MPETLLSPSNVLLYGRVVQDLVYNPSAVKPESDTPTREGRNNFLAQQLGVSTSCSPVDSVKEKSKPRLARIYGFAFDGQYYDLASPAIFIVHGPGVTADPGVKDSRQAKAPAKVDLSGVANTPSSMPDDILVWSYDKDDLSLRMDVSTGTLEQILLEMEFAMDFGPAGQKFGPSGQKFGPSGQKFGPSGQKFGPSGQKLGSRNNRGD